MHFQQGAGVRGGAPVLLRRLASSARAQHQRHQHQPPAAATLAHPSWRDWGAGSGGGWSPATRAAAAPWASVLTSLGGLLSAVRGTQQQQQHSACTAPQPVVPDLADAGAGAGAGSGRAGAGGGAAAGDVGSRDSVRGRMANRTAGDAPLRAAAAAAAQLGGGNGGAGDGADGGEGDGGSETTEPFDTLSQVDKRSVPLFCRI
ncbi:hypothetical protein FOA52_016325 [Chlamydomonas sp. UWO 241]|nr:hypothetical protein FOA52_016325 [Chlamydomonas sp. UWO 241]